MPRLCVPPAWIIVLTGLVLNIFAILINSIVLDKYSERAAQLSESKNSNQQAIQLAWNQIETLERKKELLTIHLGQSNTDTDKAISSVLRQQISLWVGNQVPSVSPSNLIPILNALDEAQARQRNIIDELYFKNVSIMEVIQKMEASNANYKNIALFLQILGLALILARDLTR